MSEQIGSELRIGLRPFALKHLGLKSKPKRLFTALHPQQCLLTPNSEATIKAHLGLLMTQGMHPNYIHTLLLNFLSLADVSYFLNYV